jgi:hypothetical protein
MRVVERRTITIRNVRARRNARGGRLKTLGGFGIGGFDLPVGKKGDPYNGKEKFVESKHEVGPQPLYF